MRLSCFSANFTLQNLHLYFMCNEIWQYNNTIYFYIMFKSWIVFRGSLFLSIQKQESSALFSTYISEGKFYISIFWQSSWKKENSYLILFWFQWWHKNSSWLTTQMSYGILIWTSEGLKKTTKKKFDIFLSIMNHVKIVL